MTIHDGRNPIRIDGFSYLPRFVEAAEASALIDYFGSIRPIWERRHASGEHDRGGARGGRLTRPVYWLGAWQFACLGYYSEPDYLQDRCLRAEPYPDVMQAILQRMRPAAEAHLGEGEAYHPSTSALINYYGSEIRQQPVDVARLRPHRDTEPGPVTMISIGQPALFEFVDGDDKVALSVWLRHRSAVVFSGAQFKDTLYHRVTKVRHGREPAMHTTLPDFDLRRISVSFRHVPERYIHDWDEMSPDARAKVAPYVDELAQNSAHFRGIRAQSL